MKPVLFWFVHLVLIEVEHFEQKKESAGTKQLLQIVCKAEVYRSFSADRCASDDEALRYQWFSSKLVPTISNWRNWSHFCGKPPRVKQIKLQQNRKQLMFLPL